MKPLLDRLGPGFADLLEPDPEPAAYVALRGAEGIGRPLGSPAFLARLAALTGRDPRPGKRGPKAPGEAGGMGN